MAAYMAVLQPGDTMLGMNLSHGGHLTHGHHLNFSGKTYHVVPYGVRREDETIDYDELARLADEHRPKLIVAGGKRLSAHYRLPAYARHRRFGGRAADGGHGALLGAGGGGRPPQSLRVRRHRDFDHPQDPARAAVGDRSVPEKYAAAVDKAVFPGRARRPAGAHYRAKAVCFLEAMQPEFVEYQKQVVANAKVLAAGLAEDGFRVVSGGTDTHLLLVDVFSKGIRGREAERRSTKLLSRSTRTPSRSTSIRRSTPAASGWAARRYHSRIRRRRDGGSRHADRRSAARHRLPGNARLGTQPRRGPHPEVPAVRLEDEVRLPGREGSPAFSLPGR